MADRRPAIAAESEEAVWERRRGFLGRKETRVRRKIREEKNPHCLSLSLIIFTASATHPSPCLLLAIQHPFSQRRPERRRGGGGGWGRDLKRKHEKHKENEKRT
jgi:hypothetical protein